MPATRPRRGRLRPDQLPALRSLDCEFLHRDELHARFPDFEVNPPVVLRLGDGHPVPCIDAKRLQACRDLEELMGLVRDVCRAQSGEGSAGAARGEAP